MAARVDIPLECQDKSFDRAGLDDGQKDLIRTGALDVVLIENAAELIRRVMMRGNNIEKILTAVSKTKGCIMIPAQTFPEWMDVRLGLESVEGQNKYQNKYNLRVMQTKTIVEQLKKNHKYGCLFSIFALDLGGGAGGHWGGFYYDIQSHKLEIFDSMQVDEEGSFYTSFFRQLGTHIFGVAFKDINFSSDFSFETSLQRTGGFLDDDASITESQSTESQNHFCYMWSIWFIHHKIAGIDIFDSAEEIFKNHVDPLVVIKRYMWALIHLDLDGEVLVDQIPRKYRTFFDRNFLAIWTNDPERSFESEGKFNRYRIPEPIAKTVDECLTESLRSEKLEWVDPTTKTDAMNKCGIKL